MWCWSNAGTKAKADPHDPLDLVTKAIGACQPDKFSRPQLPAELHVAQEWAKQALKGLHAAVALAEADGRGQQPD